jgi:GntR family transcriptional regulator/MocR family aminotransferase
LNRLAQNALKKGLYFQGGNSLLTPNFTRLGFASSTPAELEQCVDILEKLLAK